MQPGPQGVQCSPAVLVVDDDAVVRSIMTRSLQYEGWTVYYAVDGVDALGVLEDNPIDVVVSDVMMPRMDGRNLAAEIGRLYPAVPVILVSGAHIGVSNTPNVFLPKPFSPTILVSTIREVMARGSGPTPRLA